MKKIILILILMGVANLGMADSQMAVIDDADHTVKAGDMLKYTVTALGNNGAYVPIPFSCKITTNFTGTDGIRVDLSTSVSPTDQLPVFKVIFPSSPYTFSVRGVSPTWSNFMAVINQGCYTSFRCPPNESSQDIVIHCKYDVVV